MTSRRKYTEGRCEFRGDSEHEVSQSLQQGKQISESGLGILDDLLRHHDQGRSMSGWYHLATFRVKTG